MNETVYLKIYKDKNGEIDFGISNIEDWEYEKQKEIRSMLITAIYVLESMWRGKKPNPAMKQSPPSTRE